MAKRNLQRQPAHLGHPSEQTAPGPLFKVPFFSVLGLTVLSLAVCLLLAVSPNQTEEVKRLIETCSTTSKLGFGAICGLIGG
jgi:hypothetical protein